MPWAAGGRLTLTQRREMLEQWERGFDSGAQASYAVIHHDRIAGSCGPHRRVADDGLEIGYWIRSQFTRRGLATAAARALTDAALALPAITHTEIHHDKANVASGRIPPKLGYELIASVPRPQQAPAEIGIECRLRMDRDRWTAASEG